MKKRILAVLVCLFALSVTGVSVYAADLGSYSGNVGFIFQKKMEKESVSDSINGTYIRATTSIYSTFGFYQSAVLGNGVTQVSPAGEVDINVNYWCGFWSGYSTVPGNSIMAYMRAKSPYFSDTITSCTWWY